MPLRLAVGTTVTARDGAVGRTTLSPRDFVAQHRRAVFFFFFGRPPASWRGSLSVNGGHVMGSRALVRHGSEALRSILVSCVGLKQSHTLSRLTFVCAHSL